MFKIEVFGNFSAAHKLRGYKGKCENIHGHNWKVGVEVSKEKLDNIGIAMDFKVLKRHLKTVLNDLDHKDLNSLQYFKKFNPTSENIAKFIYGELKKKVDVSTVSVWEAEDSKATYSEDR
ncbi:MAG: 6-carboxytetrahydropterin synthase QueD [Candidatus Omnitrophica bacterium]|nr:6-carboxytetrahydropterin synthase QueD [Candidatus Omnitrophota bacterium]